MTSIRPTDVEDPLPTLLNFLAVLKVRQRITVIALETGQASDGQFLLERFASFLSFGQVPVVEHIMPQVEVRQEHSIIGDVAFTRTPFSPFGKYPAARKSGLRRSTPSH